MNDYRPGGFRLLPDVVKNLLIINVLVYLLTLYLIPRGIDLTQTLGLHYFGAPNFRFYQLVTYMFMHDTRSIMHIFFNMLALFMFGGAVENVWGRKKFLTYYLLCGFGAAAAHYAIFYFQVSPLLNNLNHYLEAADINSLYGIVNSPQFADRFPPEFLELMRVDPSHALSLSIDYVTTFKTELLNGQVLVGASGAIFGLLIAFGMLFPNAIIYAIILPIPIKAKYAVAIYGLVELFSGFKLNDNVAHFAHLGGLLTGLIIILIWKSKGRNGRDFFQ
jgi:membrane associated rhomboid family serine protease